MLGVVNEAKYHWETKKKPPQYIQLSFPHSSFFPETKSNTNAFVSPAKKRKL